ncbi:MAG: TIGR04283 family arsenosugar biosynthesis glycosyltransferase [Deltaproteobacteria bacterium]|nr:TIGR04283 family arsenosugar biosynthesis glycosyltransferase [Deltaproteobacteria bacterium]
MVSVVIPTLNEEREIEGCLQSALALSDAVEVIVADGGSSDTTLQRIALFPRVRCVHASKGRSQQMNAGAEAASEDILLFLHVDCRLPSKTSKLIQKALEDSRTVGGFFQAHLDHPDFRFRLSSTLLNLRANRTGGATGDQGIFVRKGIFERLGGYANIPLFEDLDLMRRMKKIGRVAVIDSPIRISPRRWLERGYFKTHLLMWGLRLLYLAGVPPRYLVRFY